MKKIIFIAALIAFISAFPAEKTIFRITQYDDADTMSQTMTLVSDSNRSVIIQSSGRMIFDYEKDTLFLIDDSLKTAMKMSVSMLGLFVAGLTEAAEMKADSLTVKIQKSEKKYEYEGNFYPQFSVYSNEEKILTVAVDENADYSMTLKSIDKLEKMIEQIVGFDLQNAGIKSINGLPKVIIYFKENTKKTKIVLTDYAKGAFAKYFEIPSDYKKGY